MELTPRLRTLAELVPQGARLVDVGTDHAYLPVWLILQGRISQAIAADLRQGPLARARETAVQYHVEEQISFRLCDGLAAITPEEVDVIAIAGMGGDTIAEILHAAPWAMEKRLLLQPMTAQPSLRNWLQRHGYRIENEHIAREGKRLYSIWDVRRGEMSPLSPAELWAGRQSQDPLRGDYLDFIQAKVAKALAGQRASCQPDQRQIQWLEQVMDGLETMKKEL